MNSRVAEAAAYLVKRGITDSSVGIILGTGLHRLGSEINITVKIPYSEIPGFCHSTVQSHPGNLLYGSLEGKMVIALQGRFHVYEGYTYDQVVFPVQVMKSLGVNRLFISNAAGALNPGFKKGQLMLLRNHLDFQGVSPVQQIPAEWYDNSLATLLIQIATQESIHLNTGTYAAVCGPQLETKAEYRYLRKSGADAVGMSTVPEVIASGLLNMQCVAVSVLTDECDPDHLQPVTLEEIISVAQKSDAVLTRLFCKTISAC